MKNLIQEKLRDWGWHVTALQRDHIDRVMQDLLSMHALPNLDVHYLPWTTATLRPGAVRALLNEIVIHQRRNFLEFGAGLSTLYLADLYRSRGAGHLVTVEQNEEWAATVQQHLEKLDVPPEHFTVVHAPLMETDISGATNDWYAPDVLDGILSEKTFDAVLVDGPVAATEKLENARYPALPFVSERLENDFVVFLDDIGCTGEQQIAQAWKRDYGLNLSRTAGMGVFRPEGTAATYDIL